MEERVRELERRMNAQERAIIELTKTISNGLSKDIASIKDSLHKLCVSDDFQKVHIDKLEEASWFLMWINQVRDNLFKTFIKAVGLIIVFTAGVCFLGQKGMKIIKIALMHLSG